MNAALILKHASAKRLSGEWNDDDYDVLADGVVDMGATRFRSLER
jgi:hypothetical protein